jgi:hypothetical protein
MRPPASASENRTHGAEKIGLSALVACGEKQTLIRISAEWLGSV